MFSELIRRNSKRNRQENTLYFVTMILTVAAFYIILALDHQDVMIFLKEMERDAVNKLLMLIPILYVVSLCLLYFLVYFTDKYQMERRSHEFGTYLMLGMKKRSLFQMLFLEDLRNIVYARVIRRSLQDLEFCVISLHFPVWLHCGRSLGFAELKCLPGLCFASSFGKKRFMNCYPVNRRKNSVHFRP